MSDQLGPLEEAISYMVYRLARLLRVNLKNMLKDLGLTWSPEQYFLMYRLYRTEGVQQADLSDPVLDDQPNITRQINRLEEQGWVVRSGHPDDSRKYMIHLTDRGRRKMDSVTPEVLRLREELYGDFPMESAEMLKGGLAEIQGRLSH